MMQAISPVNWLNSGKISESLDAMSFTLLWLEVFSYLSLLFSAVVW